MWQRGDLFSRRADLAEWLEIYKVLIVVVAVVRVARLLDQLRRLLCGGIDAGRRTKLSETVVLKRKNNSIKTRIDTKRMGMLCIEYILP